MTWNTLTDLAHDQLVTETHLDQLRQNIEHLGAMLSEGTALSALSVGSIIGGVKWAVIGAYTGDNTGSAGSGGKVITGLGFTPNVVIIYYLTPDTVNGGTNSQVWTAGGLTTAEGVTAMGSGSFTVSSSGGDWHMNKNGTSYRYIALQV